MLPDIHLLLLLALLGALVLGYLLAQLLPLQHLGAFMRTALGVREPATEDDEGLRAAISLSLGLSPQTTGRELLTAVSALQQMRQDLRVLLKAPPWMDPATLVRTVEADRGQMEAELARLRGAAGRLDFERGSSPGQPEGSPPSEPTQPARRDRRGT